MRAANFDDAGELFGFLLQTLLQLTHGGREIVFDQLDSRNVHGAGKHVVARLSEVDVVVWMRLCEMRDDLVGVHVGGSSAAGLEDIDYELAVVVACGDAIGPSLNSRRDGRVERSELCVDNGGTGLDETERLDKWALQTE